MTETLAIRRLDSTGQFIGGRWEKGQADSFESKCPVDGSVVWDGCQANEPQIDDAIESAHQAKVEWAKLSPPTRIEFVKRYAAEIEKNANELAELISAETGKPIWESKTEVGAAVGKSAVSIDAFESRRNTDSFEMGAMTPLPDSSRTESWEFWDHSIFRLICLTATLFQR